jgi:hypothetical protein
MSEFWQFWFNFWWLLFPLAGMAFGALNIWLTYRRSSQAMEVLKAYVASGREPPAEIIAALHVAPPASRGWPPRSVDRLDPVASWSAVIPFYAIGAAFAVAAFLIGARDVRLVFVVLAVAFGISSLGLTALLLVRSRRDRA